MGHGEQGWEGGRTAQCPHPPDRVVMGNDRMEPMCVLCGASLTPDPARSEAAAPPDGAASRAGR